MCFIINVQAVFEECFDSSHWELFFESLKAQDIFVLKFLSMKLLTAVVSSCINDTN